MGCRCGCQRNWLCWALAGVVGGLYVIGMRQRAKTRQPAVAAIDEPEVVEAYARISHLPQFRLFRHFFTRRSVSGYQHARVLDVGCGAGQLSLLLAQQPEVEEVTGIDLSSDMVSQARTAAEIHERNARFLQADAAEMPFPDASFDVVVSTISMHHWEDAPAVMREIRRVLAPGGKAIIFDLRRDAFPVFLGVTTLVSRFLVPESVRQTGEPIASFQASYTPCEAIVAAAKAEWDDPHIIQGPFWWVLESEKSGER